MTHMGRANALDPAADADVIQKELHSAHRHFLRCTLDCLKVALLAIARRCEDSIKALDDEMLLPASVHSEMRGLRARRIEVTKHEGQKPITEVVEKLKVLCDDYDKFSQKIETEFAGDVVVNRRSKIRSRLWKERGWDFFLGLLSGAIVSGLAWLVLGII